MKISKYFLKELLQGVIIGSLFMVVITQRGIRRDLDYVNNNLNKVRSYLSKMELHPNSGKKPLMIVDYMESGCFYLDNEQSIYIPIIAKDEEACSRAGLTKKKWNSKEENHITMDSLLGFYTNKEQRRLR